MNILDNPHLVYLTPFGYKNESVFDKLVKVYASKLNATIVWVEKWPEKNLNAVFNRGLNLVPFIPMENMSSEFEQVPLPSFDGYCFLLYEFPIGAYFRHLMVPFHVGTWIIIFAFLVVAYLATHLLKRHFRQDVLEAYFFGLNIKDYKLNRVERFALIAFTWLFFLIGEAYLAKMISFMNDNKHQPHLRDLVSFEESDYGFCEPTSHLVLQFKDIYPGLLPKMNTQNENCVPIISCTEATMFSKMFKTVTNLNFYTLNERFGWWISASVFSTKQPFAELFKLISSRMMESGLWDKWVELETTAHELREHSKIQILTFDDLISLWWLLVCGFTVSFAVFCGEKICFVLKKFKHK